MRQFLLFALLIFPSVALANAKLFGVWESSETNIRLDILDGFKPNRGAVLATTNGTETEIGVWESKDSGIRVRIDYRDDDVIFFEEDGFQWKGMIFKKREEIREDEVIVLRQDESNFINRLTGNVWLTSKEGRTSVFKSTFSFDSGVVETFSKESELYDLKAWGVSSGILKIGNDVIVEARVSQDYVIGINDSDNFIVLKAISPTSVRSRADLADQRSKFFKLLVTDVWQHKYYSGFRDYKFRPIEGPLKGRRFRLVNDKLDDTRTWEYSPSTGAVKIGYEEYIGALVIDETLALIEENGDQTFYRRKPGGVGKEFTVSDVRKTSIDETNGKNLANILSGQFQKDKNFYLFEFNEDSRTGYVHEWRSEPFSIAGHQFSNSLVGDANSVFEVEDLLIVGEDFALKKDSSASYLRPKSRSEVATDMELMEDKLRQLGSSTLVLRIIDTEGEVYEIKLPFESMEKIAEMGISSQLLQ